MTINLSTFALQVGNLIPDIPEQEIEDINIYQQIRAGVHAYSVDLPDELTQDLSGDDGKYYDISGLTGWSDAFSLISKIEYPAAAVASDEAPTYLEPEDWDESYYVGSTRYLYFPNHAPASTESIRITYTGFYTWASNADPNTYTKTAHGFSVDDQVYRDAAGNWKKDASGLLGTHIVTVVPTVDTFTVAELAANIPPAHFFAICYKIACLVLHEIATKYSRTTDPTIAADSVNHTTRAAQFAERAQEMCNMYSMILGLGGADAGGAGNELPRAEFIDWDSTPGWPGNRRFIFHGEDWR